MDYEYNCPQFYDFENPEDDSYPEAFFETRQDFSPSLSLEFKKPFQVMENIPSQMNYSDGPASNTRSSMSEHAKKSVHRPIKTVSSKFQSEPAVKKLRSSVEPNPLKKHLMKWKVQRHRFNVNRENQAPVKKSRRHTSATTVTRTIPEPFSFSTDKRIKQDNVTINEFKPLDFVASLRSNKEKQNVVKRGPVRAVPERLLRKRKVSASQTMAEKVLSFQRALSHREKPTTPEGKGATGLRVTQPITPHLRAATRSRPLCILSQDEKEELEAEEIKKYHFKAQPMNPKLLVPFALKSRVPVEVPAVVPFALRTEARATLRPRAQSLDAPPPPPPEFHARPVPRKILEGVRGLGEKLKSKPTKPLSPPFVLKSREEFWKKQQEKEKAAAEAVAAAQAVFKAPKRVRTFSHDSTQVPKEHKTTVPQPFSFHQRDQQSLAKKEERIQHVLEEQKPRNFKATPMPSPVICGIPPKRRISPTKVLDCAHEMTLRARNRADKLQKKMEEDLKRQNEAIMFKAQPCTVTIKQPFYPKKVAKPATEILDFQLHSDLRALERNQYNEHLKEVEESRLALLEERKREEEEAALKEISELRAKTVHKANPVPRIQPFTVKHGLIPVTKAVTPKFETEKRRKRKHE